MNKDRIFEDPFDLAYMMLDLVNEFDIGVNVVCDHEMALELCDILMDAELVNPVGCKVSNMCLPYADYKREFMVGLDRNYGLWMQALYDDKAGRYRSLPDKEPCFIHQSANHKAAASVDEDLVIPFSYEYEHEDEDDSCCEDCCCCDLDEIDTHELIKDSDGKIMGFKMYKATKPSKGSGSYEFHQYTYLSDDPKRVLDWLDELND